MSIKDTLKLIKYSKSADLEIVACVIFLAMAIITSIPIGNNNYMGAFWANYLSGFVVGQIYSSAFSEMFQSSEKYRNIIIKNSTIIIGIGNAFSFIIFGLIRTTVAYMIGNTENISTYMLFYCIFQVLYIVFFSLVYKKMALGVIMAIPFYLAIVSTGNNWVMSRLNGLSLMHNTTLSLIIAAVTCVVTPLIYYGITRLLYKTPFSDFYVRRIERAN